MEEFEKEKGARFMFLGDHLINSGFSFKPIFDAQKDYINQLSDLFARTIEHNRKYKGRKASGRYIMMLVKKKIVKIKPIKFLDRYNLK